MGSRSRHICGTSHDNRRQTERDEACFNCRGAKEEKQSLKEPFAKEAVQPNAAIAASGCEIIKATKSHKQRELTVNKLTFNCQPVAWR